ncbi:hypothetical protein ACWONT_003262 [Vibrio parahaemolyticus]
MARQSKRTKRKDDIFFAVYGSSGSVIAAAEAAGYSKSAVYRYMEENDFAQRMSLAKVETADLIKGSAIDLAVNGDKTHKVLNVTNPETGKKETQIVVERKRSAAMLQFLLERSAPNSFDKEVMREKRQKAESRSEEEWNDERSEELFNDFLGYLVEYQLDSIPTEDLEERIQGMQEELVRRENTDKE